MTKLSNQIIKFMKAFNNKMLILCHKFEYKSLSSMNFPRKDIKVQRLNPLTNLKGIHIWNKKPPPTLIVRNPKELESVPISSCILF